MKLLPCGLLVALALAAKTTKHGAKPHSSWGYPYDACSWGQHALLCRTGRLQSPINLPGASAEPQTALRLSGYRSTKGTWKVKNNGHTIKVSRKTGAAMGPSLRIGRKRFRLVQFHFHIGSEHRVMGKQKPMEVHFVHQYKRAQKSEYAVIGVFFQNSRTAKPDAFLRWWIDAMTPLSHGKRYTKAGYKRTGKAALPFGSLAALRGNSRTQYWAYQGSFTTPPCTEVVQWRVMHNIVGIPNSQFYKFRAAFRNNFRPPIPNYTPVSGGNGKLGVVPPNPQLVSCAKHCRMKGLNFCRKGHKCGRGQGGCKKHNHCKKGLVCTSSAKGRCCQCPTSTGRGGWQACSNQCKCGHGQGDCDHDRQCKEGTLCRTSKAGQRLEEAAKDFCCNKIGGWHACNAGNCKCHFGQGDCDNNYQCSGTLVCRSSVRGQKVQGPAKDYCCPKSNGKGSRCSDKCICAAGLICHWGRCQPFPFYGFGFRQRFHRYQPSSEDEMRDDIDMYSDSNVEEGASTEFEIPDSDVDSV